MDTATSIIRAVASGELSADAVLERTLARIAERESLHAFVAVDAEAARRQAAAVDARIAAGQPVGALAGVPVALKDNLCTSWGTTTCASAGLADYRSPYDAHVVERLLAADAIIVGKTNLDEFAMGSSTENSATGPTRNPWDEACVPGGSSGGSAAAVAAGMVPVALGSDTGGSIRQPASFCGVVGLKPSYGRVSRYGLVAFGSSLDQVGPFARTVEDAARVLQVIAGHDPRDSTCVTDAVPDYVAASGELPDRLRVGIDPATRDSGLDSEVREAIDAAVQRFADHGAEIIEVEMPHQRVAIDCYYLICTAEASSNLARFDGIHYGHRAEAATDIIDLASRSRAASFGAEVKRRIMLGTYALSSGYYDAYYLQASKVRTLIRQDFQRAFERVDVLLSPTSPVPPFELGDRVDDPLAMYLADVYTVTANLSGAAAISVPCGLTTGGLPIGLQLTAPVLGEAQLLAAARAFESWTAWTCRPAEV